MDIHSERPDVLDRTQAPSLTLYGQLWETKAGPPGFVNKGFFKCSHVHLFTGLMTKWSANRKLLAILKKRLLILPLEEAENLQLEHFSSNCWVSFNLHKQGF